MKFQQCPHCGVRVVVSDSGICPSCRNPTDAKARIAPEREQVPVELESTILAQLESERAATKLMWPAVAILVLSILALILDVTLTASLVTSSWRQFGASAAITSLALNGSLVLANAITLYGAICMIRVRSHRVAYAAAILAVLPLATPMFILGIPFGFWALSLLSNSDVKAAFEMQHRPAA